MEDYFKENGMLQQFKQYKDNHSDIKSFINKKNKPASEYNEANKIAYYLKRM